MAVSYDFSFDAAAPASITGDPASAWASSGNLAATLEQSDPGLRPPVGDGFLEFNGKTMGSTSFPDMDISVGFTLQIAADITAIPEYYNLFVMSHATASGYGEEIFVTQTGGAWQMWVNGQFIAGPPVPTGPVVITMTGGPGQGAQYYVDGALAGSTSFNVLGLISRFLVNPGQTNARIYEVSATPAYIDSTEAASEADRLAGKHFSAAPVTVAPDNIAHSNSLEAAALDISFEMLPASVTHGHTLKASEIDIAYSLHPNALSHGHALDPAGIAIAFQLTPEDIVHAHTLQQAGITSELVFNLAPDDMSHTHSLERAEAAIVFSVSPADLLHTHSLEQAVLIMLGDASNITVDARPVREITLQANENYHISLQVRPLHDIELTATPTLD